jgi:hypothetical protein
MATVKTATEKCVPPRADDAHSDPSNRERLLENLLEINGDIHLFAKEQPLLAVAVALGAGYLVGRLISRL